MNKGTKNLRVLTRLVRSWWLNILKLLNRHVGYRISDRHFYNWVRTKDEAELNRYLDLTEGVPDEHPG